MNSEFKVFIYSESDVLSFVIYVIYYITDPEFSAGRVDPRVDRVGSGWVGRVMNISINGGSGRVGLRSWWIRSGQKKPGPGPTHNFN